MIAREQGAVRTVTGRCATERRKAHGWPAVMVSDTAYERNPNYHTARDTAETLDYERMARVVDGLAAFVER